MNPPSEDICDILEQSSVRAGTFGTDLFISKMPSSPDACVCVYDTGGEPPTLPYSYFKPTIQVRVRGIISGYQSAWDKAKEVMDALHGVSNETWNGSRYIMIACMSDIIFVGYDDNNRPLLSMNFTIHRTT